MIRPDIRPTSEEERKRGAGLLFFGFVVTLTLETAIAKLKGLFYRLNK